MQKTSVLSSSHSIHLAEKPFSPSEGHRISLTTIYQTLNLFCKLGYAKPFKKNRLQTQYEKLSS